MPRRRRPVARPARAQSAVDMRTWLARRVADDAEYVINARLVLEGMSR
jgi:hypothetical protein